MRLGFGGGGGDVGIGWEERTEVMSDKILAYSIIVSVFVYTYIFIYTGDVLIM